MMQLDKDDNYTIKPQDKTWVLYMHINKINDKKYIGITCQDPVVRWGKNGNGYKGQIFFKAIQKYGWDNFDHKIIKTHLSKEEAVALEIQYIREYGSHISKHGYNVTYGGEGHLDNRVYQFDIHGKFLNIYNGVSEAARAVDIPNSNISFACTSLYKQAGGYIWRYEKDVEDPYEFYKQIDPSKYDKLEPVYQFDMQQKYMASFKNAREASYQTGIISTSILDCCRGIYRHAGGYVWRFQKDVENPNEFYKTPIDFESRNYTYIHRVLQFDFDGNYITTYDTPRIAAEAIGCTSQMISFACCGKSKSASGYLWCYEEDYSGEMKPYQKDKNPKCIPVVQLDLEMNKIAEYESRVAAGEALGISHEQIRDNCLHKQKTCHGFIFMNKEEYILQQEMNDAPDDGAVG